jgi:hypothetical protein
MSRWRLFAVIAAASAVALLAAPASAVAPEQSGWWFLPKDGATADVVPAPPDAPADGLYLFETVPSDPAGSNPFAIAAVRFVAAPGTPATLTLTAAGGSLFTGADVRACRATTPWAGTSGAGAWSKRPGFDCASAMAFGIASSDGASMSWPLGAAFERLPGSGTYDVVLVPWGPLPFRIGIAKPGPEAVEVFEATDEPEETASELPRRGAPVAEDRPPASAQSGATPTGESLDVAPDGRSAKTASASGPDPARDSTRGQRVVAALTLLALAAALWWFGSSPARPARFLGSAGSAGRVPRSAPVRGVGRFARPRRGRAAPL